MAINIHDDMTEAEIWQAIREIEADIQRFKQETDSIDRPIQRTLKQQMDRLKRLVGR